MKIKLFCAAGMSTSLLVAKMRESAKKINIDIEIDAYPINTIQKEAPTADVVLLGPQVTYLKKTAAEICSPLNIPFDVINMQHYGMVNGKAVLEAALKMGGK